MNKLLILVMIGLIGSVGIIDECRAQKVYTIDRDQSNLSASIKYSLVGEYHAKLRDFEGLIRFDPNNLKDSSVEMTVFTASLYSKYPKLDRIVLSKLLLNADQFPEMTFLSNSIYLHEGKYYAKGVLTIHGVSKAVSLPFEINQRDFSGSVLKAHGAWYINRKDFDIVWSELLDRAGLVVGNHIKLEWEVVAVE